MDYSTELVAIPDGKTALPVNDIQKWLKCASITDKNYTTLTQVLLDMDTFIALISDSNACDYMARSTDWASGIAADANAMALIGKFDYCANKLLSNSTWLTAIANSTYFESVLNVKVPKMTSNTAPEGEAFASSYTSAGYEAWHAFNQSVQSPWFSATGTFQYVGYKFTKPVIVNKVYLDTYLPGYIGSMKIQGSNDNTNWVDLCDFFTVNSYPYNKVLNNSTAYTYYRLYATVGSAANSVVMDIIQFYGREETTCIPLVPKMTSNTTPSGEVICDTSMATGTPVSDYYQLFDGAPTIGKVGLTPATTGYQYYGYNFGRKVAIDKVDIWNGQTSGALANMSIIASDDGLTWNEILAIGSYTNTATCQRQSFNVDDTAEYNMWAVKCQKGSSPSNALGGIQFYTSADPATQVLFRSAAQDDLYYMDNGSPVIIAHTDDYGYAVVDRELLPEGENLTLYSTVAKDPSSLGNPYSRVIHFSKYLTDVYMLPFNSYCWFGYMSDIVMERQANAGTFTQNTNNIAIGVRTQSSNRIAQVRSSTAIELGSYSSINAIFNADGNAEQSQYNQCLVGYVSTTSEFIGTTATISGVTTSQAKYSYDITSVTGAKYPCMGSAENSVNTYLYALWLE